MDGREFELKNSKFRAGTAFEIYVIEEQLEFAIRNIVHVVLASGDILRINGHRCGLHNDHKISQDIGNSWHTLCDFLCLYTYTRKNHYLLQAEEEEEEEGVQ